MCLFPKEICANVSGTDSVLQKFHIPGNVPAEPKQGNFGLESIEYRQFV